MNIPTSKSGLKMVRDFDDSDDDEDDNDDIDMSVLCNIFNLICCRSEQSSDQLEDNYPTKFLQL